MKIGVPGASYHTMHVLAVAGAYVYEQGLVLAYQETSDVMCVNPVS